MARPRNPGIRARFRDQAVEYVLSHGVADLALRPLAKALKTSARMLIYHFGSREVLMREILSRLRELEDARIQAWFQSGEKPRTMAEFLSWYWKRLSAPRARPAVRLIFELYVLALKNPRAYPGVLEGPLTYWQKLTEKAGIPAKPDPLGATLLLATTRGLLLDLCATGDRARVEQAMDALAGFVEWRVTSTKRMARKGR